MTSNMPTGWATSTIGEIARVIGGGTPKTAVDAYWGKEVPWLTPKDLSSYKSRYIQRGKRSLTTQGLEESSARLLPTGTILVSSRAPIGYVAIAANPIATNQGFKSLVLKDSHLPEFFYYVMKTKKDEMEAIAGGSTFKEISGSAMKTIMVPVPPIEEQRAIAEVLGALDDRIEWCAKLRTDCVNMLMTVFGQATNQLVSLGDVAEVIAGQSPPGSTYNTEGEGLPFFQGSAQFGALVPTAEKWCSAPKRIAEPGDLLFSVRAPVGDLNVASEVVCIGRGLAAIRSSFRAAIYAAITLAASAWSIHDSSGTVFGSINGRDLRATKIQWPDDVKALTPTLDALFDRALAAEDEIRSQASTRDTLLPQLLSGELRIEDPAQFLESVA